jgi:hypothetical protein
MKKPITQGKTGWTKKKTSVTTPTSANKPVSKPVSTTASGSKPTNMCMSSTTSSSKINNKPSIPTKPSSDYILLPHLNFQLKHTTSTEKDNNSGNKYSESFDSY